MAPRAQFLRGGSTPSSGSQQGTFSAEAPDRLPPPRQESNKRAKVLAHGSFDGGLEDEMKWTPEIGPNVKV